MSNDNWKMPEPVFQRTSGSLPEDFAARAGDLLEPLDASPAAPIAVAAAIEPQPLISEQFSVAEIDTTTPVVTQKNKGGSRSIMFAVGIFVLLAIVAGFVALVYFLLFRQPPQSTF